MAIGSANITQSNQWTNMESVRPSAHEEMNAGGDAAEGKVGKEGTRKEVDVKDDGAAAREPLYAAPNDGKVK